MPTMRCSAACTNCGTHSSPKVKTKLPREVLLEAIKEASALEYGAVVFTGGEALLEWDTTLEGIRYASSLGLGTRVVSNAFWARTADRAKAAVSELVDAGLGELNLSTGDEHARFVPLESVVRAIEASVETELPCLVMVELREKPGITGETLLQHPRLAALRKTKPGAFTVSESPWMSLDPSQPSEAGAKTLINHSNVAIHKGCESVLRDTTVYSDGTVLACCGIGAKEIPELRLGTFPDSSLSSLDQKSRADFLKRWLRVDGPEKILAWAARLDPSIKWENMYSHRCQACLRLYQDESVRQVIRSNAERMVPHVIAREWLLFEFDADESHTQD
jgi:hypothetical protein